MSKLFTDTIESIYCRIAILLIALILCLNASPAFAHLPDVEITSPLDGDSISGIVAVSVVYGVAHGQVHTLQLRIDGVTVQSVAVHQQSGSHVFNWDSSSVSSGPHIMEVRAYTAAPPSDHYNSDSINVNIFAAACNSDMDCDDGNEYTDDVCQNSGTPDALCVNEPIACLNDGECGDENALTLDACDNPGTMDAVCSHTVVACAMDSDCDDGDAYTLDACENGGTEQAVCAHVAVACLSDADCDDADALTLDDCLNAGTAEADCLHTPFACNTNANCDDADAHTADVCVNGGTAQAVCSHDVIACLTDSECDDENALTLRSCLNPGTTASACSYTPIACNVAADCADENVYTADACAHGGTAQAACSHEVVACLSAADCDDGNVLTIDSCSEAGSVLSMCAHVLFACNTSADCDDGEAATVDSCENGGTLSASCAHGAVACMSDGDCDDGDTLTLDSCTAAGTADAACAHDPLSCAGDADCDDGNSMTIDACSHPGTAQSACEHTPIACNTTSDCDDGDALTLDACNTPGTADAACAHTTISCNNAQDCDDGDAATTDACAQPGTINAACSHTPVDVEPEPEPEPAPLSLEVTSPTDGLITNQPEISVSGAVTPGALVTIVDTAATVDAVGAYINDIPLIEGANTIEVTACMAGECISETRTVVLDTVAPEVGAADVYGGAVYVLLSDNPDGSGLNLDAVNVTLDGDTATFIYDQTRKALRIDAGLDAGSHTVTVSAADMAGNAAQKIVSFDVAESGGLRIDILDVPGRILDDAGVEENAGMQTSLMAQEAQTPDLGFPSLPLAVSGLPDNGQGFNDFITEWYEKHTSGWPQSVFDFGQTSQEKFVVPSVDCDEVTENAPVIESETAELAVDGDVVAEVIPVAGDVVETAIEVRVDGEVVPHEYDRNTKKIRARARKLKRGRHTVEVTAADTTGGTGTATTAFGVDPNIISMHLENADAPGTSSIGAGQRFKVTVTMDEADFTGAWIMLDNPDNGSPNVGDGQIGHEYYLAATASGSYVYETIGYLYTSQDRTGQNATRIQAGIPLDAPPVTYLFASETLTIDNPPVSPVFTNAQFWNVPLAMPDVFRLGDTYRITSSGSPGVQDVLDMLLNFDTVLSGVSNPVDAAVRTDSMIETPFGSGIYETANAPVILDNLVDSTNATARVLLPLVCAPGTGGNACALGALVYMDAAPQFNSIVLGNLSAPGQPFTQPGQAYKVTIYGSVAVPHLPYLQTLLMNADRIGGGLDNADPTMGPMLTLVQTAPGVYEATGTLEDFTDGDGFQATRVTAAVSAAAFFEYTLSNEIAIQQQQPGVYNVQLNNLTYQDRMTVAVGESVLVTAQSDPGATLECRVEATQFNTGGKTFILAAPMSEGPAGHYSCSVVINLRPDVNGSPAHFITANAGAPGAPGEISDNILTYRDHIVKANLRNLTRYNAPDIMPGERFEITADGDPGLADMSGVLIDAPMYHTTHPGNLQSAGPMIEETPGHYRAEAILNNMMTGVYAVRAFAGNTYGGPPPAVLSTEILNISAPPPQVNIYSVKIHNTTYPNRTTIAIGEGYEITAEADPGLSLTCFAKGVRINSNGNGLAAELPMTETSPGHYTCAGIITIRPDVEGLPADLLIASVEFVGAGANRETNDFLTFRGTIIEAHLSNASRLGATGIAPGEKIKIIAIASPGLGSINGGLLDARIHNSPLPGGPFLQTTDPLTENPAGSGQYSVESVLIGVPKGLTTIRGYAGNIASGDPLIVVLTTETLDILAEPPTPPTTITTIDGVPVANNEATLNNLTPVIEGTAPASATVNIYELIAGGTIGTLDPLTGGAPLSAVFTPGAGTYGDNFDNNTYEDNWRIGYTQGAWTAQEQNGQLEMGLDPGATVGLDGQQEYPYSDHFNLALDVTFPSFLNPPGADIQGRFALNADLHAVTEYRRYTLDWNIGQPNSASTITLTGDGVTGCSANYDALALDTAYRLEMDYNASGEPRMHVRINGAEVLNCTVISIPDGKLRTYIVGQNYNSPGTIHFNLDNYDTGITVPDSYNISGPAMSLNGIDYNGFGPVSLLITPCNGTKPDTLPAATDCLNAGNDIHVFAARLYGLQIEDTFMPEFPITLYTAGGTGATADQLDYVKAFMGALEQGGIMTGGYSIDAQGIALHHPAEGWGSDYTPAATPIPASLPICGEQPGPGGYLRWDTGTSQYIGSYTPLIYNGETYNDFVIWGMNPDGINPNIVSGGGTPVWWATGSEDITAGVFSFQDNNNTIHATGYATAGLFTQLPSFGVTVHATAPDTLTANNHGIDYTWNASALTAAGLSPVSQIVCNGYGRDLIATTTTANNAYATQTISLQTYTNHLIYAESIDPGTSIPLGQSAITTYHIQKATGTVDTTPPAITFTSHTDGQLISNSQPFITATVTDTESGVDWTTGLSCQTTPTPTTCNVVHTTGDTVEITFSAPLPDGMNTVTLTAADTATPPNTASATLTLDIDATPPQIVNVAVAPDIINPNTSSAAITANVLDAHLNGWYLYIYDENNDAVQHIEGSGAQVSFIWDGTNETGDQQPDGVYTIIIGTADTLGNIATEATATVILDTTPPAIAILDPADGAWISPAPYTVRVQATDLNGISAVSILLNGVEQGNATYKGNNIYEYSLNFTGLKNVDRTITAVVADNAANNATATAGIHIPNNAITIESITFVNLTRSGATDIGIGESFEVVITSSRKQAIPSLRIINTDRWSTETGPGVDIAHEITTIDDRNINTTFQGVLLACADNDGQLATHISAVGSIDGFTTASLSGSLNILTCAPQPPEPPMITEPDNGDTTRDATPTVRGTAQPGVNVYIYLENTTGGPDTLIGIVDTVPDNGRFATDTLDLGISGQKTIFAIAEKQVVGTLLQSATSNTVTFTLRDTEKPIIISHTAVPNPFSPGASPLSNDETIISAEAVDDNLVSWRMRIFDANGTRMINAEGTFTNPIPDQPTPFSYTWDGYRVKNNGTRILQPEGVYTYEILVWDDKRKSDPATGTIIIDNTAPTVAITDPVNSAIIGGIQYKVLTTANDAQGIATIDIYIDGVVWHNSGVPTDCGLGGTQGNGCGSGESQWTAILAPKVPGDGLHTLSAVARDIAGNPTTHTINITIDTVAPNPPENLTALDNGDGSVTLLWTPPTTNEDGSPLTDLAGYNIYAATWTQGCQPIMPADSTPITCEPGSAQNTYNIIGPSLVYESVTYNQNPLGGTVPLWLDAQTIQNTGATLAQALSPLPLTNSSLITPGKPIFAYIIQITTTARSGLFPGAYSLTIYTQATEQQLADALKNAQETGQIVQVVDPITAITTVCNVGVLGYYEANSFPLNTVPGFDYQRLNSGLITEKMLDNAVFSEYFAITSVDSASNESILSKSTGGVIF